jgi:hypothetical protein
LAALSSSLRSVPDLGPRTGIWYDHRYAVQLPLHDRDPTPHYKTFRSMLPLEGSYAARAKKSWTQSIAVAVWSLLIAGAVCSGIVWRDIPASTAAHFAKTIWHRFSAARSSWSSPSEILSEPMVNGNARHKFRVRRWWVFGNHARHDAATTSGSLMDIQLDGYATDTAGAARLRGRRYQTWHRKSETECCLNQIDLDQVASVANDINREASVAEDVPEGISRSSKPIRILSFGGPKLTPRAALFNSSHLFNEPRFRDRLSV